MRPSLSRPCVLQPSMFHPPSPSPPWATFPREIREQTVGSLRLLGRVRDDRARDARRVRSHYLGDSRCSPAAGAERLSDALGLHDPPPQSRRDARHLRPDGSRASAGWQSTECLWWNRQPVLCSPHRPQWRAPRPSERLMGMSPMRSQPASTVLQPGDHSVDHVHRPGHAERAGHGRSADRLNSSVGTRQ
jgi:hypothetical protein